MGGEQVMMTEPSEVGLVPLQNDLEKAGYEYTSQEDAMFDEQALPHIQFTSALILDFPINMCCLQVPSL